MARKPASHSAKTRKGKPPHAKAHIKRTAAKHQARRASRPLALFKKAMAKTFAAPKLGIDLPVVATAAFVAVLGVAVG